MQYGRVKKRGSLDIIKGFSLCWGFRRLSQWFKYLDPKARLRSLNRGSTAHSLCITNLSKSLILAVP